MCANPRDSCRPGSGDNGLTCTGGPSGCIPGSLVPTHLYTAARDHLDGGRTSQCSSTPWSQQLGYHSIDDPVIRSRDSGSRFPTRMYSSAGADRIHTYTPEGDLRWFRLRRFLVNKSGYESTATHPIYLENETDSVISSMGQSTPVKTPARGLGSHHQPLTSTPKLKLKLLVAVQQHRDELAVKQQRGPPWCTRSDPWYSKTAQTRPPGPELHSRKQNVKPGLSGNSSFVSVKEHSEFTTATLMRRDAPHKIDPDEDIVSIRDSSDIEMVSTHEYDRETEDSLPDSDAEGSHHPSDGSDMESDQDQGFWSAILT